MKLIIGLGNPGAEYEGTRHNAGFMAVDALAGDLDAVWTRDDKRRADIAKIKAGSAVCLLAKPVTFMNLSGEAARTLAAFYKTKPRDMLIVHDDADLPTGSMRFKAEGSAAGHKGVGSVHEALGATDIARLRIGIGRPKKTSKISLKDYVLGKLSPKESPKALDMASALRDWIEGGTEKAANKWNRRKANDQ